MQQALLPLFPLQVVLLPGSVLPLHIFEDRYKELMTEVLRDHTEFGVVQAGEKGIVNTGCTATIEKVLRNYPDGRMDILAVGRRRFEIILLNDERSYLRGSVEFFDDEDSEPAPGELVEKATEFMTQLETLDETEGVLSAIAPGQSPLSFRMGRFVKDLDFRQMLLGTRSEAQRLRALTEFVPSYVVKLRHVAHVREVAPKNGHGRTLPDLEI